MYIKSKYSIFGIFFLLSLFFSFGFAKDDCDSVFGPTSWSLFSDFLSTGDLEIARNHLRSYCCVEKPILASLSGKCENLEMGPESPYWYDHLIDVGLRKLDAESMYPNMEPDLSGKEWREFIKNNEKIKTPGLFQEYYLKYWTLSGRYLFSRYESSNYATTFRDIINESKGFNLHDKYINYCFISMMMYYQGLNLRNIDIVNDGYYSSCLSMVKARIRQETNLAVMLSQQKAAMLLQNGMTAYTKQFVQNRLMKLFDKFVAISSLFNTLAAQAPLSDTCTK